jgi:hypothetical protein
MLSPKIAAGISQNQVLGTARNLSPDEQLSLTMADVDSAVKVPSDDKIVVPGRTDTSESSDEEVASINETSLLRKIDLHLLPAVGILYLLSFLDRSNGKLTAPMIHTNHQS